MSEGTGTTMRMAYVTSALLATALFLSTPGLASTGTALDAADFAVGVALDQHARNEAQLGQVADVLVAYSRDERLAVPPPPQAPDTPDAPDVPTVPDAPDAPDAPTAPDAPAVPDAPDALDVPDEPTLPDGPSFDAVTDEAVSLRSAAEAEARTVRVAAGAVADEALVQGRDAALVATDLAGDANAQAGEAGRLVGTIGDGAVELASQAVALQEQAIVGAIAALACRDAPEPPACAVAFLVAATEA